MDRFTALVTTREMTSSHLQQPGELGLPVGHVARLVGGERLDHLPQTRQRQVDALKVSILRPQRGVINHLIFVVKVKVARKVQVGLQMLTSALIKDIFSYTVFIKYCCLLTAGVSNIMGFCAVCKIHCG